MSAPPANPTFREFVHWVRENPRDGDAGNVPLKMAPCWQCCPKDHGDDDGWLDYQHACPAYRLPPWMWPWDRDPYAHPPINTQDCLCSCEHFCGCLCGRCRSSFANAESRRRLAERQRLDAERRRQLAENHRQLAEIHDVNAASRAPNPSGLLNANTGPQYSAQNGQSHGDRSNPSGNTISQGRTVPQAEVTQKILDQQANNRARQAGWVANFSYQPDTVLPSIEEVSEEDRVDAADLSEADHEDSGADQGDEEADKNDEDSGADEQSGEEDNNGQDSNDELSNEVEDADDRDSEAEQVNEEDADDRDSEAEQGNQGEDTDDRDSEAEQGNQGEDTDDSDSDDDETNGEDGKDGCKASATLEPSSSEQNVSGTSESNALSASDISQKSLSAGQGANHDADAAYAEWLAQSEMRSSRRSRITVEEHQRQRLEALKGNKLAESKKQETKRSKNSGRSCQPKKGARQDSHDDQPGPGSSSQASKQTKQNSGTKTKSATQASSSRPTKRSRGKANNDELESGSNPPDTKRMRFEVDPEAGGFRKQAPGGGGKGRTVTSSTGQIYFEEARIPAVAEPEDIQRNIPRGGGKGRTVTSGTGQTYFEEARLQAPSSAPRQDEQETPEESASAQEEIDEFEEINREWRQYIQKQVDAREKRKLYEHMDFDDYDFSPDQIQPIVYGHDRRTPTPKAYDRLMSSKHEVPSSNAVDEVPYSWTQLWPHLYPQHDSGATSSQAEKSQGQRSQVSRSSNIQKKTAKKAHVSSSSAGQKKIVKKACASSSSAVQKKNGMMVYTSSRPQVSQVQRSQVSMAHLSSSQPEISQARRAQDSMVNLSSASAVQKNETNAQPKSDPSTKNAETKAGPKTDVAPKKNTSKAKTNDDTAQKKKKNGAWTNEEYHLLYRAIKARRDLEASDMRVKRLADVAFWKTVLEEAYSEGLSRTRTNNAARFFWSRIGRERSRFDERLNKPESGSLTTCAQDKRSKSQALNKKKAAGNKAIKVEDDDDEEGDDWEGGDRKGDDGADYDGEGDALMTGYYWK